MKYIFLLGQSNDLAKQEIINVLGNIEESGQNFVIAKTDKKSPELINILGGTVKIARLLDIVADLSELTIEKWLKYFPAEKDINKKFYFGFSLYGGSQKNYKDLNTLALQLKKKLKNQNLKVRLVTSKEPSLSSVIVAKNNLLNSELVIIKDSDKWVLGITEAVQDFVKYGQRDMQRPQIDKRSGVLPPKVAQMMINLAGPDRNKAILDPFCGSGTILQEAMLLSFKKIYGSDLSQTAVDNTIKNIAWLKETFVLSNEVDIKKIAVQNLSQTFSTDSIDLIVTEPFMGDARLILKQKDIRTLENVKTELQQLYSNTFQEFNKILKAQGKVVFIFPVFNIRDKQLFILEKKISPAGFKLLFKTIYSRPGQRVQREITLWQKSN